MRSTFSYPVETVMTGSGATCLGCTLSATYEREFRGILGGDAKTLASVEATLSTEERDAYASTALRPFLVVRAAGSLGADLVALRQDVSFIVEVKSSKQRRIHFSDSVRLKEQIGEIRRQCERSGVLPLYAFRLKRVRGDAWRIFTLAGLSFEGRIGELAATVPKIEKTVNGNDVLHWDAGLPLSKFLGALAGNNGHAKD